MKYLLLLLLLVFSHININAQNFILTDNGIVNSVDIDKKFVVIEIENKTQNELYLKSIEFIQKNYLNPNIVIKGQIENDFISFKTHTEKIATYNIPLNGNQDIQAEFYTTLEFKDGKIKIEILNLELYYYSDNIKVEFNINYKPSGWSIYNKKGELNKKAINTKSEIENYFNEFILNFKNNILDKNNVDKW